MGSVRVQGAGAASFLHSQLTNDVEGLAPGEGNLSARVQRTGHLVECFSLHRFPDTGDAQVFLLLGEAEGLGALVADLDLYLFADQVEILLEDATWWAVQGGEGTAVLCTALGEERAWEDLPSYGSVQVGESRVVVRSLTGDRGYLVSGSAEVGVALEAAAVEKGLAFLEGEALSAAIEALRIEAGVLRVGADCAGKKRLLPETGIEQQAVSYTKGCYLGQEVIARVRTYGSVPRALRALVLSVEEGEDSAAVLSEIPAPGEAVQVGDKKVGTFGVRTWSETLQAPVVMAFLDRKHRTPGAVLELEGNRTATVALLPLYTAPDSEARVAFLYDRAIRVFAGGDEAKALKLLGECLAVDPAFSDAYELIGVILGRSGRYHEAIDFFRRLEELAPEEPMVHTNLSLYYMKLGDKTQAEDESAKATTKQFRQTRWKDRSTAEIVQEQAESKHKEANRKQSMFAQVLEFDPEDSIALFGMGGAMATLGDHLAACQHLSRASAVDANNSAVYLRWGKSLEALEKSDEALDVYRKGMDVASRRGDLMPLREMEHRVLLLEATQRKPA
jgi:folate-binding protein YgfZ